MASRPMQFGPEWMRKPSASAPSKGAPASGGGAGAGAPGPLPNGSGRSASGSSSAAPLPSPGAFSFAAAASGAAGQQQQQQAAAASQAGQNGAALDSSDAAGGGGGAGAGAGGAWSGLSLYGLGRPGKNAAPAAVSSPTTASSGAGAGAGGGGWQEVESSSKRKVQTPLKSPSLDSGLFRKDGSEPARGLNARGVGVGGGSVGGSGAGDKPRGFSGGIGVGVLGGPIGRQRKDSENGSLLPRSPNPAAGAAATDGSGAGAAGDAAEPGTPTFGGGGFFGSRATRSAGAKPGAGAGSAAPAAQPAEQFVPRDPASEGVSGSSWAARFKRERAPGEGPIGPPADHSGGFGRGKVANDKKRVTAYAKAMTTAVQQQHQQARQQQRLEDLEDEAKILDVLRLEEEERQAAREVDGWSPDSAFWFYRDYEGNVQGPFSGSQMQEWYAQSYFKDDLAIRREEEDEYRPLGDVVKELGDAAEPFLVPPPRLAQAQAQAQAQPEQAPSQLPSSQRDAPQAGQDAHAPPQNAEHQQQQQQQHQQQQRPWPNAPGTPGFQNPLTMFGQAGGMGGFPGAPFGVGGGPMMSPMSPMPPSAFGIPGAMSLEDKLRHQDQYLLMLRRQQLLDEQLRAGVPLEQRLATAASFGMGLPPQQQQQQAQQQQQQQAPWGSSAVDAWGQPQQQQPGMGMPASPFAMHQQQLQQQMLLERMMQMQQQQQQQQQFQQQQQQQQQMQQQPSQQQQPPHDQQQQQQQAPGSAGPWDTWGSSASPEVARAQSQEPRSVPGAIGTPRRSRSPAPAETSSDPPVAEPEPSAPAPAHEQVAPAPAAQPEPEPEPAAEPAPQQPVAPEDPVAALKSSLEPGEEWVADPSHAQQMQTVTSKRSRNRKAKDAGTASEGAAAGATAASSTAFGGNLSVMTAEDFKAASASGQSAAPARADSLDHAASPATPSKPAPWAAAAEEKPASTSGLSLREIQAAELKAAEAKKALERQAAANRAKASGPTSSSPAQPITMSWGLASQPAPAVKQEESSAAAAGSPWGATAAAPAKKKTLAEIQEEEKKRAQRAKEIAAAARAQAMGTAGKGYADSAAAARAVSQPTSAPPPGWSVVGASGKPVPGTASPARPTTAAAAAAAATTPQRAASASAAKPAPPPVAAAPAVRANGTPARSATSSSSGPSPEFIRHVKDQLKGLSVNVDDFVDMLLSFPLDPSPDVVEIIAESVYANSSTLDGRRFAAEFVSKRKMDAQGRSISASAAAGAPGLSRPSASEAAKSQPSKFSGFQVVGKSKKKGSK